jgi:hypothetical protein
MRADPTSGHHLEPDWLVTGPAASLDQIQVKLTDFAERLSPEVLLLSFGNAVGHFRVPVLGISLAEVLHLGSIAACARRATGEKFLIDPNLGFR